MTRILEASEISDVPFVEDKWVDGELVKAVVPNAELLCKECGLDHESEVPIISIRVTGTRGKQKLFEVGEGKYKSALWVWYWLNRHSGNVLACTDHSVGGSFVMTPEAIASAASYFGEDICRDASRRDTVHEFVHWIIYDLKGAKLDFILKETA